VASEEITDGLIVEKFSRLILVDDTRPLKGFNLQYHDYLVRRTARNPSVPDTDDPNLLHPGSIYLLPRRPKDDLTDLLPPLSAFCKEAGIVGIPVVKLSNLNFYLAQRNAQTNVNHRRSTFTYNHSGYRTKPYSKYWEVNETEPTADDVFVVMAHFEPPGNFYQSYNRAVQIAAKYGGTVPLVRGYKTTQRKPVKEEDCLGTPFHKWYNNFILDLLTKNEKLMHDMELYGWATLFGTMSKYTSGYQLFSHAVKVLRKGLGKNHPLTWFTRQHRMAARYCGENFNKHDLLELIKTEATDRHLWRSTAAELHETLFVYQYPLFSAANVQFRHAWDTDHSQAAWLEYVKAIDTRNEGTK
jgi:hypothetical protein